MAKINTIKEYDVANGPQGSDGAQQRRGGI